MFIEGLRLGLLLQLAVGPVCLMVFNTAGTSGLMSASLAAFAVTLVDTLYILLAGAGVSAFLQDERVKNGIRFFGAFVLFVFGLDIIMGALAVPLLPQVKLFDSARTSGVFLKAVLLTASNPLTIVFWGGVFSTAVAAKNMNRPQLVFFGLGCICATFIFLNAVALGGSVLNTFLSKELQTFLNVAVGVVIIVFGMKMLGLGQWPRKK